MTLDCRHKDHNRWTALWIFANFTLNCITNGFCVQVQRAQHKRLPRPEPRPELAQQEHPSAQRAPAPP